MHNNACMNYTYSSGKFNELGKVVHRSHKAFVRVTSCDNKSIDLGTEELSIARKSSISCLKDLVKFGQVLSEPTLV